MKLKITSLNFTVFNLKDLLALILLLSSFGTFAQIIVESVSPRRITTQSRVSIISMPGETFSTEQTRVSCGNIFPEATVYLNSASTELAFRITRANTYIAEAPNNDLGPTPLLINGLKVYTGTPGIDGLPKDGGNQVFLEYVAPTNSQLTQQKSYYVKEIYTNWEREGNNFWSSSEWVRTHNNISNDPNSPNDDHELLGFKMSNGIIYSTGVGDDLLKSKLNLEEGEYVKSIFKAYSTNGVQGNTVDSPIGTFIIAADLIDGVTGSAENASNNDVSNLNRIDGLKVFDAIIDGKHGLNLGIGITNFNTNTEVKFFSGNGQPGVLADKSPDLLITQIADAGGEDNADIYFYADQDGDIIGRPIKFWITEGEYRTEYDTRLSVWQIDLFRYRNNVAFNLATPVGRKYFDPNRNLFKPLRMAAFDLEDFGITTPQQVEDINNINMNAGGSADMAFLAYNQGTFNLKSPVAKSLLSKFVCRVVEEGGNTTITFELVEGETVGVESDAGAYGDIRYPDPLPSTEALTFEWSRYNTVVQPELSALNGGASLTIPGVNRADLGTYKVKIGNGQGTIVLPVDLSEGGTPYYWENGGWSNPYDKQDPVDPMEKGLVFREGYDGSDLGSEDVLEGCDCVIKPGADVIIPDGKTLKLYNNIVVEGKREVLAEDGETVLETIPAGTFTLENNASLIQTKAVTVNENTGNIIVKRDATGLKQYDYVYWSSPVEEGELSMIPGATQHVYKWEVNQANSNQTLGTMGNWFTEPSGVMQNGRGYIKRVNDASNINASFEGVPNNGNIGVPVYQTESSGSSAMTESNKHWNLIGNPYPSAINPEMFLEDNKDLVDVIQVWVHKNAPSDTADDAYYQDFKLKYSNDYLTYNLVGPTDHTFNGFIASGQGFMVKAVEDGDVKFTNAMRFDANTGEAHDNSQFFREANESNSLSNHDKEKQLIWIALTDETKMATVALIGYAEGATNGKDRLYDASSGSGDMRIYSILDASDFIIQGRALPFQDSDQVPLGIEILKNGIYKIGIDHLKGSLMLNEDQGIYLEDTYNNVIHNLRNKPYGFTATKGDIKDRFVLRYTNEQLSVADQDMANTFVYVKNNQLYVKASKNIEAVVIYDLTGKRVMDHKVSGITDAINTPFQFPKGVYLTEIKLENAGAVTKKVMH